ncbi:DUF6006 family protein [Lysobacter sp. BMK333-48F3]|uniref:DUF6006 family protein n=1 Tax=Lysobacter sp. BMK333-48F3 TaxID=2867962 RepID=UPI001C8C6583|nr:DUF6006 family protein [Lysobacter sp. BMK333-48F3]MBX9403472.1 DUF6006 family protein [Lysobacter sp. BMK333-48F3]
MNSFGHRPTLFVLVLALGTAHCAPAQASQVGGWWGGDWTCTIDGRPARMRWTAVDDTHVDCDGDESCSQSSGARWRGRFSDNGSAWVALNNPRPGVRGGLFFNHADGNRWYLPRPSNGRSNGWTTWNGQRYPLSCWR